MGLFSHKHLGHYGLPLPMGAGPPISPQRKHKSGGADDPPDEDDAGPKKTYEKEKAPEKPAIEEPEETETQVNTRLNALLFGNSDESPDLYKSENSLLDLLGRLYYDEYDSDSTASPCQSPHPQKSDTSNSSLSVQSAKLPPRGKRPVAQRSKSFEKGILFDTLSDTHHMAVTYKLKHPQFKFRRNNKTFLIGFNNDIESLRAVEWVFQELVVNGDTVIVLQVLDDKVYKLVDRSLAKQVLDKLERLNTHFKKISLVYEAVIGKPQKLLAQAVEEYKPAMMIVGTHDYEKALPVHLNSSINLASQSHPMHTNAKHRGFLSKGSVSKYFLQFALVPCIVVKPFVYNTDVLEKPIDGENYFKDWIASTDVTEKTKKKSKNIFANALSPLLSRNNSLSDLTAEDLERPNRRSHSLFYLDSRDNSPVRSASKESSRRKVKLFGL